MINKTIQDFWGNRLKKCSYNDVKKYKLNSNTKEYLTKIGIPVVKLGECDYFFYFSNLKYQKVGEKEFAVFAEGISGYPQLGINLASFEIDIVFPETNGTEYKCFYFNKDIQTYFYCFTSMINCKKKYPMLCCDYESEEADKQQFLFAQELYGIINSIDRKAASCGSRWTLVLMELAEGELGNHYDEFLLLLKSGKYENDEEAILAFISGKETFLNK